MIKRLIKIIFYLLIIYVLVWALHYYTAMGRAQLSIDKSTSNVPDPKRPYFDSCGNEYDYKGNMIAHGKGCVLDYQINLTPFKGK